jgi:hypothetical protein
MSSIPPPLIPTQEEGTLFCVIQGGTMRYLPGTAVVPGIPRVGVIRETIPAATFTDGGATVGTKVMAGSIPAGAILLGSKLLVPAGFAGNVSATITIGDGSVVDRYMTGTPSIFATAATGVQTGVPSGNKLLTAVNQPTLTVTTSTDFTLALNGGGIIDLSIFFLLTV